MNNHPSERVQLDHWTSQRADKMHKSQWWTRSSVIGQPADKLFTREIFNRCVIERQDCEATKRVDVLCVSQVKVYCHADVHLAGDVCSLPRSSFNTVAEKNGNTNRHQIVWKETHLKVRKEGKKIFAVFKKRAGRAQQSSGQLLLNDIHWPNLFWLQIISTSFSSREMWVEFLINSRLIE